MSIVALREKSPRINVNGCIFDSTTLNCIVTIFKENYGGDCYSEITLKRIRVLNIRTHINVCTSIVMYIPTENESIKA
jgi:hypothetical protein